MTKQKKQLSNKDLPQCKKKKLQKPQGNEIKLDQGYHNKQKEKKLNKKLYFYSLIYNIP